MNHTNKSAEATSTAFYFTRLLNIPFWVLLNLLPVILYKNLNITPWLITVMIAVKPASAILASYWGTLVHERRDRLLSNLIWGNILRYIPFLFVPWMESPLLIVIAFGLFMVLSRGVMPAWMEIFKLNFESSKRSQVFAVGSSLDYIGSAILPIGMGWLLDDTSLSWKALFPITAVLGLASTIFLLKVPLPQGTYQPPKQFSFSRELFKPWKEAWKLIKERNDFAQFQLGFMIGASGLMVMQPVIPIFFVDILNLSYTELFFAMAACKAVGYALASPFCIRLFNRWNIYNFSSGVILLGSLFPLLLIASQFHPLLVYGAYLLYGAMQAGSELSWHMSGPVFSKEHESSLYSMTNVLSVGLRGCFAPLLGSLIFSFSNSTVALLAGAFLCISSALQLAFAGNNNLREQKALESDS